MYKSHPSRQSRLCIAVVRTPVSIYLPLHPNHSLYYHSFSLSSMIMVTASGGVGCKTLAVSVVCGHERQGDLINTRTSVPVSVPHSMQITEYKIFTSYVVNGCRLIKSITSHRLVRSICIGWHPAGLQPIDLHN